MKLLSPVVWHEGMHLSQHHFQAQSRYMESLASFSLQQLSPGAWGLLELGLDEDALTNGTAAILHGRGILPDGTPFHFPDDPLPASLAVGDLFSPTRASHRLLLALPAHRPGRANVGSNDDAPDDRRFAARPTTLVDEVSGEEERTVHVARPNFRLLLEDDEGLPDDTIALPIARIRRDGSGHFVYDPDFIAPSLRIGAEARLVQLVARLVDMLEDKAANLRAERSADPGAQGGGGASGGAIARLWLAHAVHAALPPLHHLLQARDTHPELLFAELSRLAGALCTFSFETDPRDLPIWNHADPEASFLALESHIRGHLELVLPVGATRITLHPADPVRKGQDEALVRREGAEGPSAFRIGAISDPRVFGNTEWYLSITTSGATADVIARAPDAVRICAARFVPRLVRDSRAGIGLEHVPHPPSELGDRPGTVHFRLLRTEPCWTAITKSGEVGIHLPESIPGTNFHIAVLPGG